MQELKNLSLQLLQATQALHDKVQQGELEQILDLQQQRATLVAALDKVSQQEWSDTTKLESRALLEQAQQLEKLIVTVLSEKRDAIKQEYSQLQRNQKARKAYGSIG